MKENKVDLKSDRVFNILLYTMFGIAVIAIIVAFACTVVQCTNEFDDFLESENKVSETTISHIASIKYDKDVSGNYTNIFVLGQGQVFETTYYVAYEILEDGGKKLVKYEAGKTIIYDNLSDDDKPYVEYDKNKYGDILAVRLYLPVGTITEEYDLNIE